MSFSARTIEDLARSGLDESDARLMHIEDLSASDVQEMTGGAFKATAFKLPYPDRLGNFNDDFYRIRFHEPQARNNAKPDKKERYWQPPGTGVNAYLPPMLSKPWAKILPNGELLLYLVEGEKKAAAAAKYKLPTIGLGGVRALSSKKQDVSLLPELIEAGEAGHEFRVVFDGDNHINKDVRNAEHRACQKLIEAGATVWVVQLPPHYALDDYLLKNGVEKFMELPATPFDVRAQIAAIRQTEKSGGRGRNERIWSLMSADLNERGKFHVVKDEETTDLYYFNEHNSKLHNLGSHTDRELRASFNELYGTNASESEWNWLYEELANHAILRGTPTAVHSFTSVDKAKRVLYVYGGAQNVFRITPDGWESKPNGIDGKLFRNFAMEPVEVAKEKKSRRTAAELLINTPNFKDGQFLSAAQARMLYELWWWSTLFPELMPTRALLLLNGPMGSAKTSAARRYLQTLLGPQVDVTVVDPKRLDGVVAALSNNHIVVLDNADGAISGLENMLAIGATGGKFILRELYTTNASRKIRLTAFIAATSRDPKPFRRSDVADRLLPLTVDRRASFLSEAQINAETSRNRPAWWRYALDTLPAILKALCSHRPKHGQYRLADFAQFCFAVGPVLGYPYEAVNAALQAVEKERNEFTAEGSSLPSALEETCRKFEDRAIKDANGNSYLTAEQLLNIVRFNTMNFPFRSAQSLGIALNDQMSALRIRGIHVEKRVGSGRKKQYRVSFKEPKC
jgi:hypothetical protein